MTELSLHAAGVTNVGLVRRANEDSMLLRDDAALWCVADGMGGHKGGQWASQQVRDALGRVELTEDFENNLGHIEEAIRGANAIIVAAGEQARAHMGTTVAALHVVGERFAIFWAGDSRVYLCRQDKMYRLTTDHTHVQLLIDSGLISHEEARHHPEKHVLSRAVGVIQDLELDLIADRLEPYDRFVLCSDGLTAVVSDAEIGERAMTEAPDAVVNSLLELVLSRGAPDNTTIALVACEPRFADGLPEHAGAQGGMGDV